MTDIQQRFREDPLYFEKTERDGLEIWYRQDPNALKFGIAVIFRNAGQLAAPSFEKWELAHCLEHLLFQTVEPPLGICDLKFSSEQAFQSHMRIRAYTYSGTVYPRCTQYTISGLANDLNEICNLMGGILNLSSDPQPEHWDLVLQHIRSEHDTKNEYHNRDFWRKSLYGEQINRLNDRAEHCKTLENITFEDAQCLYENAYVTENCSVVISGNFTDQFLDLLPQYLGIKEGKNKTTQLTLDPLESVTPREDVAILPASGHSISGYSTAFIVPAQGSTREHEIAHLLQGAIAADLWQELRSRGRYMTESDFKSTLTSERSLLDVAGRHILEIYFRLPDGVDTAGGSEILKSVLKKRPLDPDQLVWVIDSQRRFLQGLGNSREKTFLLALQSLAEHGRVLPLQERIVMLNDINPHDIVAYAKEHLCFEKSYRICFDPEFKEEKTEEPEATEQKQ